MAGRTIFRLFQVWRTSRTRRVNVAELPDADVWSRSVGDRVGVRHGQGLAGNAGPDRLRQVDGPVMMEVGSVHPCWDRVGGRLAQAELVRSSS